ncbi:MAG: anaerobic ribonucleoside-triphosphate reductase-activating protein [Opitutales bacterium]|nr:anaerobic ribonucleoside-triphosphate reductase-activating protein [Opitutales bacterium]
MQYHQYFPIDVVNGPGTRCTLFVSGCEHRCPGCYNPGTWNPESGHPFDEAMVEQILNDLNDTRIRRRGLSLSGGDPLFPENCAAIENLCRRVRESCPGKDIWLWTGYLRENLTPAQERILPYVDVLVDGPFIAAEADPALAFRGSHNQRILTLA